MNMVRFIAPVAALVALAACGGETEDADGKSADAAPPPDELVDVLGAMALASRQASSPSSASDASQPSVAAIVPRRSEWCVQPDPHSPDLSAIPPPSLRGWHRRGTHVIVALERPRPREARIDEARDDDDDGAARDDVDGAVGPIGARDDDGDWDGAPPRDGPARG